jgi:hypothetical protein
MVLKNDSEVWSKKWTSSYLKPRTTINAISAYNEWMNAESKKNLRTPRPHTDNLQQISRHLLYYIQWYHNSINAISAYERANERTSEWINQINQDWFISDSSEKSPNPSTSYWFNNRHIYCTYYLLHLVPLPVTLVEIWYGINNSYFQ